MPHRAPRLLTLILATAGTCLAATTVYAQSQAQPAAGRYLTWANRPASTTPADVVQSQTQSQTESPTPTRARNAMIPRRVAPSQAPYRPMIQPAAQPLPASRGLTPADAWLGPRVAPAYAPGSPDPIRDVAEMAARVPVERAAPQPQPQPRPVERAAVDPMTVRRDAPVFNLPRPASASVAQAPSPAPAPAPALAPQAAADVVDPMAPRRDALIFQVQQSAAPGQEQATLPAASQVAPSNQASVQSGQSGARYYSVHRDAGHRPDPTPLPEPVYFDSVSMDLAEPPAAEVGARDAQGRRRVVANEDPALP